MYTIPSALWKVEISVENCFVVSWHYSSNVDLNLGPLLKTLTDDAREAGYYTLRRKQFFCKFFRNKVLIIAWDSIARNVWVALSTSRFTNGRANVVKTINETNHETLCFYWKVQTTEHFFCSKNLKASVQMTKILTMSLYVNIVHLYSELTRTDQMWL